jgi:methionyl-tRNA synthetase
MENIVNFSDWEKIELRVAEVIEVEEIFGADKLYKLTLDVGEFGKKVVCAGLKEYYKKEKLKGKKLILFCNLAPRLMKGIQSQGMILAAVSNDHKKVLLVSPEKGAENGWKIS